MSLFQKPTPQPGEVLFSETTQKAAEQLEADLNISYVTDGVDIRSPSGKNRFIWWSVLVFGLVLAMAPVLGGLGVLLPVDEYGEPLDVEKVGSGVSIVGFLLFFMVGGLLMLIAAVSLWGSLTASVRQTDLKSYWSIFGLKFSRQQAKLTHPGQFTVSRAMTIHYGEQVIEKFNLDVRFRDKDYWLANNIEGRAAVDLLRQRLAEHLFPGQPLPPIQFPEK